jgi:hypothetical protein
MKNKSTLLKVSLLAAIFTMGCFTQAEAQVAAAPANNPGTTFITSVSDYFTSINTNFTFAGTKLEMSSGYKQVNGVNAASELYAQFNISDNFDLMGNFQFSGIGSAINAVEGGLGYAFINHYDVKLQGDLLAGWDSTKGNTIKGVNQGALVVEPRAALKKKLTPNTYAETAISLPFYSIGKINTQPSFYIGVGFTY